MLLISEIRKVLMKIGKESNCEEINPWIRGCENHLTWSATSTSSGDGKVILAKFLSFLDHILDKHDNLENPLFNKCAHEEIEPREWLDERKLSIRLNFYETTQELGRCIWVAILLIEFFVAKNQATLFILAVEKFTIFLTPLWYMTTTKFLLIIFRVCCI